MTDTIQSAENDAVISDAGKRLSGKYLTFILGKEEYGLEILKVQEIIQMQKVTRVPKSPEFVRGVINLRGKVIPVIELRKKFNMPLREDTDRTCIIVVLIESKGQSLTMGIIIDEVKEVLDIGPGEIEEPPSFGDEVHTEFIMGIGKIGESVKMLLDIDRVLTETQLDSLNVIGD